MHTVIEYVFTGLIIVLLIQATIQVSNVVVEPPSQIIWEQQLLSIAEYLEKQILLSPGDPPDWGVNYTLTVKDLRSFGLAEKSSKPYSLDADKIFRIVDNETPLHIPSSEVIRILNIERRVGIRITLTPALNITITPLSSVSIGGIDFAYRFRIHVSTHENIHSANAKVIGFYLLAYKNTTTLVDYYVHSTQEVYTDWRGEAELNYASQINPLSDKNPVGYLLVVSVDFYGLKAVKIYRNVKGDVLNAKLYSNYLIVSFPMDEKPKSARHMSDYVYEFGVSQGTSYSFTILKISNETNGHAGQVINRGAKKYRVYALSYVYPETMFVMFTVKTSGKYYCVTAFPSFENTTVLLGPLIPPSGVSIVNIRRLVYINGASYYVDIQVWRMVE